MEALEGVTLTVVRTGVPVLRASAMAWIWAEVRLLRLPIPPLLELMAFWIWVAVLPFFAELARAPWQPAQFAA